MVRITDCPDMTSAVHHGCKSTNQRNIQKVSILFIIINNITNQITNIFAINLTALTVHF